MKISSRAGLLLGLPLLATAVPLPGADPLGTWLPRFTGRRDLQDVTFGNHVFVTVGGAIFSSGDAVDWSYRAPAAETFYGITYGDDMFIAVGSWPVHLGAVGCVGVSTDGETWTAAPVWSVGFDGLTCAAYGNGTLVAGQRRTLLISTTDLQNWTPAIPAPIHNVAFGDGRFVAVGLNGLIETSTNGADWRVVDSGVTNALADVVYANNLFVVVGAQGTILRSSDGITWIPCASPATNVWISVTSGAGIFMAAGRPSSEVVSSTDGEVWQLHKTDVPDPPSGASRYFYALTFGAGTFVGIVWTYAPYALASTEIYQSAGVQVQLGGSIRSDLNAIELTAHGGFERAHTLQGSTNLTDWTDLLVFTNSPGTNVILDAFFSTAPRYFYRAEVR